MTARLFTIQTPLPAARAAIREHVAAMTPTDRPGVFPAVGPRRARVALLRNCVQPALAPGINAAAIALLTRHGVEVVVAQGECCGALPHHLGKAERAHALAKGQIAGWSREIEGEVALGQVGRRRGRRAGLNAHTAHSRVSRASVVRELPGI